MATDWGTPVIEWIAKLSLKAKWITKLSVNTIVIFMLLVAVANKAYHEMECSKIRAGMHKVEGLQRRCTRDENKACLLYTSPSPRDRQKSRMPSSA